MQRLARGCAAASSASCAASGLLSGSASAIEDPETRFAIDLHDRAARGFARRDDELMPPLSTIASMRSSMAAARVRRTDAATLATQRRDGAIGDLDIGGRSASCTDGTSPRLRGPRRQRQRAAHPGARCREAARARSCKQQPRPPCAMTSRPPGSSLLFASSMSQPLRLRAMPDQRGGYDGRMLTLVLGDRNLSSWSFRAWLLLRQLGAPVRGDRLALDTPAFRPRSCVIRRPRRVPVLLDGDLSVWDSLAIGEYVDELTGGSAGRAIRQPGRARGRCGGDAFRLCGAARPWPFARRLHRLAARSTLVARRTWPHRVDLVGVPRTRSSQHGPWLFGRFLLPMRCTRRLCCAAGLTAAALGRRAAYVLDVSGNPHVATGSATRAGRRRRRTRLGMTVAGSNLAPRGLVTQSAGHDALERALVADAARLRRESRSPLSAPGLDSRWPRARTAGRPA